MLLCKINYKKFEVIHLVCYNLKTYRKNQEILRRAVADQSKTEEDTNMIPH